MSTKQSRKLFVNLPIENLARSVSFFTKLGFSFNPQFTDESSTCMLVGEDSFVMLLEKKRFQEFTKKTICDTKTHVEALFSFSQESRAEVDRILDLALSSGATKANDPADHGFMYLRSFLDLDGHHWEVFFMDQAHVK